MRSPLILRAPEGHTWAHAPHIVHRSLSMRGSPGRPIADSGQIATHFPHDMHLNS
jgi:hypothetical protein